MMHEHKAPPGPKPPDHESLTVGALITMLERIPPEYLVLVEGCDCYRWATCGVELLQDAVVIETT